MLLRTLGAALSKYTVRVLHLKVSPLLSLSPPIYLVSRFRSSFVGATEIVNLPRPGGRPSIREAFSLMYLTSITKLGLVFALCPEKQPLTNYLPPKLKIILERSGVALPLRI